MLTQERALELFHYDEATGKLFWRVSRGRTKAGNEADCATSDGYLRVAADGRRYRVHRVIFLMKTGRWPVPDCDHRDLNGVNNLWNNLREATRSQNKANEPVHCGRTDRLKGAYHHKKHGGWSSRIKVMGKMLHLGYFKTKEEAHECYKVAADKYFGEFAYHNSNQ